MRQPDSHLVDKDTSDSECEIRPVYRWRSGHHDSPTHVSQRSRDNVIPVVDTSDEHNNESNHEESEVEPEVISDPEHVIDNESDDIVNTVKDAEAPVGQRGRTVVSEDEEVQPQRNSPRRGKRAIKPDIRLTMMR